MAADLKRRGDESMLRRLTPVEPMGRLVRVERRELINLASNDYLGLSQHSALRDAAIEATRQHGTGAGASRLAGGHSPLHAQVEAKFAAFKHTRSAPICPTGYMANHATLTALAGPGDLVCVDKLNHASLLDAARATGAAVRVFPHLRYEKLERLLARADSAPQIPNPKSQIPNQRHPKPETRNPRALIVTDSVFSMDGDTADLPALCDLADKYDAILVVDEAHGTGVLGEPSGGGLCELQGVADRVDVVVSTASKALGSLGGIITARQEIIDTIVNRARSFIFTTAVPPAQAASIGAALDVISAEPWRRTRLHDLAIRLRTGLSQIDWIKRDAALPQAGAVTTPILPIIVGTPERALSLSAHLRDRGFLAPAIRPPTVPPGSSRVRLSLRADLEDADIDALIAAVAGWTNA